VVYRPCGSLPDLAFFGKFETHIFTQFTTLVAFVHAILNAKVLSCCYCHVFVLNWVNFGCNLDDPLRLLLRVIYWAVFVLHMCAGTPVS
jgi:hypothetical protein